MTRKLMAAAVLMAAITTTGAEKDAPKIGEPVKLDTPVVFIGDSMIVSAKKMGRTRMKLASAYRMMKAAPPCSPTI